ncbi:MAG: RDD family protein [Phycisphaerae bacterium]|nr:RDD family protein [Phycisphaerae bacterium]
MILVSVLAMQCVGSPVAMSDALWFSQPASSETESITLCVAQPSLESNTYTPLRILTDTPAAMAASGASVWVAPSDQPDDSSVVLIAMRSTWDPTMGVWQTAPTSGLDRLPAVSLGASLSHLLGSAQGPVVIGVAVKGSGHPVAALRHGRWTRPADIPTQESVQAAATDGSQWSVLVGSDAKSAAVWRYESATDTWSETPLSISGQPHDIVATSTGLLVGAQRDDDVRELGFLQDGRIVPWIQVSEVSPQDQLIASGDHLWLYRIHEGNAELRRIDRVSGSVSPWRALERQSGFGARAWSIMVSIFIALAVVFVLFVGRGAKPTRLPDGLAVAPLARRGLAFVIDLVPGVVVTVVLLDVSGRDVFAAALAGPIPSTAILLLLMAGVTVVWCLCWELISARTPGKRAMGLVMVSTRGDRIRLWQIVVRNVFKGAIVLAPPIAIIVMLTPAGQGLGDVAAGTVVLIRPVDRPAQPE